MNVAQVLGRLAVKGVTNETDGVSFADYLVKLNSDGKLSATLLEDLILDLDSLTVTNDAEVGGTLTVLGDLVVSGNMTTTISEVVNIEDNIITLNSNFTSGVPSVDAGIEIKRGNEVSAQLLWDESEGHFVAGTVGSLYELAFLPEVESLLGALESDLENQINTHTGNTSNPHSVTKAQVGLGNADNTSDVNKPISTATQTALNLKANLASPTLTGTPAAPTAAADTNTTQIATTAFAKTEADDAQAFAIQRANHTGTQLASTISDFSSAASAVTHSTLVNGSSVITINADGSGAIYSSTTNGNILTWTADGATFEAGGANIIAVSFQGQLNGDGTGITGYAPSFSVGNADYAGTCVDATNASNIDSGAGFVPSADLYNGVGGYVAFAATADSPNDANDFGGLNLSSLFDGSGGNVLQAYNASLAVSADNAIAPYDANNFGGLNLNGLYDGGDGWVNRANRAAVLYDEIGAGELITANEDELVFDNFDTVTCNNSTDIFLSQALGLNHLAADDSVAGSTSGVVNFSFPIWGQSFKKVMLHLDALDGTATVNFPSAFNWVPAIIATNGLAPAIVTSLSVSAVTVTGTTTTGWIILEGY